MELANKSSLSDELIMATHLRLAKLKSNRRQYDWDGSEYGQPICRPEQTPNDSEKWRTWLYLGGRGTGKTRSAGEHVRKWIKEGKTRVGLIAPTAADARDIMVQGESGLMAIFSEHDVDNKGEKVGEPLYQPSKRRLTWANGAIATLYTAEEPLRLRGPQHDGIWADELCAWKYMRETFDMAWFGLRLSNSPQMIITTTPKPINLLREIVADQTTYVTRGSTFDNEANLPASFIDQIRKKYEGTTLGKQELYATILEEAEGALWLREWIEKSRCNAAPDLARICVSVDPAVTANEETSNETGIIVCGTIPGLERGFVIEDLSGIYTPLGWAKAAIDAYYRHNADFILAEVNNGGDLVVQNIKNVDNDVPVKTVHARKGKYLRAEPIAALYEQGRVFHVGSFEKLEDQMVCWMPLGNLPSPDRIDALVHGLTSLMIKASLSGAAGITAPGGAKIKSFFHDMGI